MLSEQAQAARRVYQMEYRRKNRERIREYDRQYRATHREQALAAVDRYWERKGAELEGKSGRGEFNA